MADYPYTKTPVDTSGLLAEIEADGTITDTPDRVRFTTPDQLVIVMPNSLSGAEETALNNIVTAHAGRRPTEKFYVRTDDARGNTTKEEWFEVDDGDGTFSKLARSIDYTYSGKKRMSETHKSYSSGGATVSTQTWAWFTLPGNQTSKKRV